MTGKDALTQLECTDPGEEEDSGGGLGFGAGVDDMMKENF
jgi:hypothetical protein